MAISHAECTHPRTPAGRRACRAGNSVPVIDIKPTIVPTSPGLRHPEIKMTGAVARRMAKHAAAADRAKSRRTTKSDCVQAALHTAGRCACGWHTESFCNPAVWPCSEH